jgi:type I restriction enzyme S subunit
MEISKGTVGAVQLKLPIKNIQSISIDILPQNEMKKLDKVLKPIISKISSNIEENQRLATLRDTLLPKLMNGEIDVSTVKI